MIPLRMPTNRREEMQFRRGAELPHIARVRGGAHSCGFSGIVERNPLLVFLAGDGREPGLVLQVPAYGARKSRIECLPRRPPELAADLRRVDRVAAIVPGAVLDERDALGRAAVRLMLGDDPAQLSHKLEIG